MIIPTVRKISHTALCCVKNNVCCAQTEKSTNSDCFCTLNPMGPPTIKQKRITKV